MQSAAVRENCRRRAAALSSNTALERSCELLEMLGQAKQPQRA